MLGEDFCDNFCDNESWRIRKPGKPASGSGEVRNRKNATAATAHGCAWTLGASKILETEDRLNEMHMAVADLLKKESLFGS